MVARLVSGRLIRMTALRVIMPSQGRPFYLGAWQSLAGMTVVVFVCGHYEGDG